MSLIAGPMPSVVVSCVSKYSLSLVRKSPETSLLGVFLISGISCLGFLPLIPPGVYNIL